MPVEISPVKGPRPFLNPALPLIALSRANAPAATRWMCWCDAASPDIVGLGRDPSAAYSAWIKHGQLAAVRAAAFLDSLALRNNVWKPHD